MKPRDSKSAERDGGGRSAITRRSVRNVNSSVLGPSLCIQSITAIHSSCAQESKYWAKSMAANDGTSRITVFLHCSILVYISIIILLAWALTHDPSEKLYVSFLALCCDISCTVNSVVQSKPPACCCTARFHFPHLPWFSFLNLAQIFCKISANQHIIILFFLRNREHLLAHKLQKSVSKTPSRLFSLCLCGCFIVAGAFVFSIAWRDGLLVLTEEITQTRRCRDTGGKLGPRRVF